jgi:multiple sugar transport system ATP-binding protein
MDEPLSNLDALLRLEMRAELKSVLKEAGTTTLYVTHDQTEAMGLADRIAVMHKGVIEQIDEPTRIYSKPSSLFVGGFVGSPPMNFLNLVASGGSLACEGFSMPLAHDGPVLLGFRGEDVSLVEASRGVAFEVKVIEPMGSHLLLTGVVNGERIRVVAPPQADIARGMTIGLQLDAARVVVMDTQTGKAL